VSSCLIVKDIAQTVFRCSEPTKKTRAVRISVRWLTGKEPKCGILGSCHLVTDLLLNC